MAVPTLSSFWLSKNRKDLAEQAIVSRRNQEAQRLSHWNAVSEQFRKADLQCSVYSALENSIPSSCPPKANVESCKNECEKEAKRHLLEKRRTELSALLREENQKFMEEMEEKEMSLREKNPWNVTKMKKNLEELQRKREEERAKSAQNQLYRHWRTNNPNVRKMESDSLKKHMALSLKQQLEQKMEYINKAKSEQQKLLDELEKHRQRKEKEIEEYARLRKENVDKWIHELDYQLEELKRKEIEAQMLKSEEIALLKRQQKINEIQEKQYKLGNVKRKKEMSIALLKQSKDRLRQKGIETENELKLDQQVLDFLSKQELKQEEVQQAKKEKAQADVRCMQKMIEEQIKLEKERQAELQLLYYEEAERMWKKREAEWDKEREARRKLMNEVLEGQKNQVQSKINENLMKQQEMFQEQANLCKELDEIKRKAQEEKEIKHSMKRQLQHDLKAQIEDRLSRYEEEKRLREEELARFGLMEREEAELVAKEGQLIDMALESSNLQRTTTVDANKRPTW